MSSLVQVIGLMPSCTVMFAPPPCSAAASAATASAAVAPVASPPRTQARERLRLAPQRIEEHAFTVGRPQKPAVLGVARAECLDAADIAERKAPAERHQRRAAARQCAQHLCAFGAAETDATRDIEPRKLLAAEPTDLIEFVHAHIDEHAATAGVELRRRRFAIPLVAGKEIQCAQFAIGDALTQALQCRHEAPPYATCNFTCVARGDRSSLARLTGRDAARLLAEDRQSGSGNPRNQATDAA